MELNKKDISKIMDKKKEEGDNYLKNELIKDNLKEVNTNISLINVDSYYRNKIPKNITEVNKNYLQNDPITTQKGSSELKFYMPNHGFNIGDTITISNVQSYSKTFSNSLYLIDNFNYLLIKFKSHNIDSNYSNYNSNLLIQSSLLTRINSTEDVTSRFYGNIPINMTLGLLQIFTLNDLQNSGQITNEIIQVIISTFDEIGSNQDIYNNFIFIPLEFSFTISELDKSNRNIKEAILGDQESIFNIQYAYNISFMDLQGIPLNTINSDYPITYQRQQGNQEITNVEEEYFYINTKSKSYSNGNFGGDKIIISKILKTIPGFPSAGDFTIQLKKNFTNVTRIEMVSSEIPFIENTISEGINNKLYWQNYEDGDKIYSISLPSGNYSYSSLINNLSNELNKVERVNSINEDLIYNLFEIEANNFTSEIKFKSFTNTSLPNSITSSIITINLKNYYKLTIKHPNNFVEVKDEIEISGCDKIDVISKAIINTKHVVYEIDKLRQTYSVILPPFNVSTASSGNGGLGIKIKTPTKSRFLFNRNDTIGNILWFRRPGDENSITKFRSVNSNLDDYEYSLKLDSVGNFNNDPNLFETDGNTTYWLLYLNDYESLILSGLENCFSKLLITSVQGEVSFNSFVNNPVLFEVPIPSLNELSVKVTDKYGNLVNFLNNDFSFTLRIYEIISNPIETKLVQTNYIEEVIKKASS